MRDTSSKKLNNFIKEFKFSTLVFNLLLRGDKQDIVQQMDINVTFLENPVFN